MARWVVLKYYGNRHVILEGQVKLDNNNLRVDFAPAVNVIDRNGSCDITDTKNRRLSLVNSRSVRFEASYRVVCGIFPSWEDINIIYEIDASGSPTPRLRSLDRLHLIRQIR